MFILEAINLQKQYINGTDESLVLHNINLHIKPGELVALMGPSGSGKSTLLYNLSGIDPVTSGDVILQQQELSQLSDEQLSALRLNNIGFIFQQIHLLKNLSVYDNIILPAYLAKQKTHASINQRAAQLMQSVGISELANHDITKISGGQAQRVAICRALINSPNIIFGDEPTGALNSQVAQEVMEILTTLNQTGVTILLATHDVKIAAKAERILYLKDGTIIAELTLDKYDPHCNTKKRETMLFQWLDNMGF